MQITEYTLEEGGSNQEACLCLWHKHQSSKAAAGCRKGDWLIYNFLQVTLRACSHYVQLPAFSSLDNTNDMPFNKNTNEYKKLEKSI